MTRHKLALINIIIFAGAVAIIVFQWPHVVRSIGDSDDAVGMILLEALMAGIPIVLWAAAAHYVLTRVLMKRGEMEDYHARQEIARLPKEIQSDDEPPHDMLK